VAARCSVAPWRNARFLHRLSPETFDQNCNEASAREYMPANKLGLKSLDQPS
jgi:hypothetical protein